MRGGDYWMDSQFHGLFLFDGRCKHVKEHGAFRGLWRADGLVCLLRKMGITRGMRPLQDRSGVGARAG